MSLPAAPLAPALRWPQGGAAVLLLHGFGADRLSWLANQPAIEMAMPAAALDLPGHGAAGMDVGDGGVETLARHVAAALDAHAAAPLHIVGHSLGGAVAMVLARQRPDLVRSLALIAPAGLGKGVDVEFLAAYPNLTAPDETVALMRRLAAREGLISKLMVKRALDQLERPGARAALRLIAQGIVASGPAVEAAVRTLSASDVPRLVVWGREDLINPLDEGKLTAFGGERLVVEGAGHLPHIEGSLAVNERLLRFLGAAG